MRYTLAIIISMVIIACGPSVVYEEKVDVGGEWSYDEDMNYSVEIVDTSQVYDLVYRLVHSDTYRYQNLYVLITTVYPDGKSVEDQVSLQLADKLGQFSGRCSGDQCKVDIMLQESFRFTKLGTHTFTIAQYSRDPVLQGIESGILKLLEHKSE